MSSYIEVGVKTELGLRNYMIRIYQYVALALCISGISAYFTLELGLINSIISFNGITGFGYLVIFSPMIISFIFSYNYQNLSTSNALMLFVLYAALTGISLSTLGLIYTSNSIVKTFFICAITFMSMSIFGYTTKTDLTSYGSFLYMGVIGLFVAGIVNIFLQSSALYFATSLIGVLVFTCLIAFTVQEIKNMYSYAADDDEAMQKYSILAALNLYVQFINLFVYMLRFLGERRRD